MFIKQLSAYGAYAPVGMGYFVNYIKDNSILNMGAAFQPRSELPGGNFSRLESRSHDKTTLYILVRYNEGELIACAF